MLWPFISSALEAGIAMLRVNCFCTIPDEHLSPTENQSQQLIFLLTETEKILQNTLKTFDLKNLINMETG